VFKKLIYLIILLFLYEMSVLEKAMLHVEFIDYFIRSNNAL